MATYVNDLRLKEIATGDESGTWGTSTNTNLELIAEAFSFGTEAITTNADTHTTTIADGATDPGRSLFLKYTGTLDSTCTITIGPNTVSKLWFIENATSGSQDIIIKQGSGATVTIPNGQTKAIYSDGAGASGAMVDAFTDLSVPSLFLPDNGKAIFGAGSDLEVYHDASDSIINDNGTGSLKLQQGGSTKLEVTTTGIDVTGTVTADGLTVDTDTLHVDSTNDRVGIGTTSPNDLLHIKSTSADAEITLESTFSGGDARLRMIANSSGLSSIQFQDEGDTNIGFVNYDHSDNSMHFRTNDAEAMRIDSSGQVGIGTTSPSSELHVDGTITYDGRLRPASTAADGSAAAPAIVVGFDYDTGFFRPATNTIGFATSGTERMRIDSSGNVNVYGDDNRPLSITSFDTVSAGAGWDLDATSSNGVVTVSTGGSERLRIDSSGQVGIGTSSPSELLHVQGAGSTARVFIESTNTADGQIEFQNSTTTNGLFMGLSGSTSGDASIYHGDAKNIVFSTSATERARIDSSGNLLVGTTTATPASTTGVALGGSSGYVYATRDGNASGLFNRLTSDGDIAQFRKAGTTVGSIGSNGGTNLYLTSGNRGIRFNDNDFSPITSGNAYSDNTTDLGRTTARFKNIYLSNQIIGGFGAQTTSGTTDWNHSTNARSGMGTTLLLGNATNGPGATGYFHAVSFEYTSKDGSGNMTQLAIGYNSNRIFMRYRYSNSWSSWTEI